jgi:uncharacterized protein (DUF924 family)
VTAPAETIVSPAEVLAFWRAAGPDQWFERDDAFDAEIREKFLPTYTAGAAGRLDPWQSTPDGTLALLVLLDQFPRNLFRGDASAFATDAKARSIAEQAIARGADRLFDVPERRFFYMPLMHSENLADQERCIALCRDAGDAEGEKHAEIHADVIRRFGRFPHRNRALGRADTDEERAFLAGGGFGGP